MRKLVTLRKIDALNPIDGADAIEVATVEGWKVVVKKGEFNVGDPCLYFEIDSFLPDGVEAWQFLVDKQSRVFEGVKGHRLRTVKLRGQISQGLVLKPDMIGNGMSDSIGGVIINLQAEAALAGAEFVLRDVDFAPFIGVKKWEAELPTELAGLVKGYFPSFIQKTDQERCQNLIDEIFVENMDAQYEVTIKLDGTSATFYHRNGDLGVCSRNLELKICPENASNTFIKMLNESRLAEFLPHYGNIAVQGEIMGPGIQGNRENFKTARFFIFDVYLIDEGRYMAPAERRALVDDLLARLDAHHRIGHVPVVAYAANLYDTLGIVDIDDLLKFAEGKSIEDLIREGLVFKRIDGGFSFKVISNLFLQKEKY